MAVGGVIDITTPYRQFEAPGRCIYCRRKAFALQKEHIIPFGLAAIHWFLERPAARSAERNTRL